MMDDMPRWDVDNFDTPPAGHAILQYDDRIIEISKRDFQLPPEIRELGYTVGTIYSILRSAQRGEFYDNEPPQQ